MVREANQGGPQKLLPAFSLHKPYNLL